MAIDGPACRPSCTPLRFSRAGIASARITPASATATNTSTTTPSRSFQHEPSPRKHEAADELPDVLVRSDRPFPRAQLERRGPCSTRNIRSIRSHSSRTGRMPSSARPDTAPTQSTIHAGQPPGFDDAQRRPLLSSNPFCDAPRRVGVAIEQLHDGAVDERAERQRPSSSLSSRCSSAATSRLNDRTACEPRRSDRTRVEPCPVCPERGSTRTAFCPLRDVKSALADGDCHHVLPLRQPERRVAGMRDHFLEHEVAALSGQHRVAGGIGRRREAGARRAIVLLVAAPALSISGPFPCAAASAGTTAIATKKAITRLVRDIRHLLPPSPSLRWPAARPSARRRDELDVRMTSHGTCRAPLPPVRLCRVRPA